LTEARLKFAVFIDFDNIEIGVKTTLNAHFDVGAVLEAIKERGEVVTKVAYGDWTRAGDYSRSLTQHAIHMVQRNLTPGGDKNGADINLALDALEMAFTHSHINAFVIVGGDSDFMALVEKLKQYDRKVFIVGGRAFTSMVLQKNCHEFIAYENLVGRRSAGPRGRAAGETPISQAVPLVRRALKVLVDREVTPQLGVLKSTLLQLDSTFSEREYGAGSFRDFIQKLAKAGFVTLKGADRSLHVWWKDGDSQALPAEPAAGRGQETPTPAVREEEEPVEGAPASAEAASATDADPARLAEGFALMRRALVKVPNPRWPFYVRQLKQLFKSQLGDFDERKFGFNGLVDAARYCQKQGLLRVDRDRMGVLRVYAGPELARLRDAGSAALEDASAAPPETVAPETPHDERLPLDTSPPAEGAPDEGEAGGTAPKRRRTSAKSATKRTVKKAATSTPRKSAPRTRTARKPPDTDVVH
jgi:uncharacterized LabA/DUF88 family protein